MINIKIAKYYNKRDNNNVLCYLCPQHCMIKPGSRGLCRTRLNQDGVLYSENYAMISSLGVDPIEKKPLYHFYPGSNILSVGTFGCNFTCSYCQNWQISQDKPQVKEIKTEQLITMAEDRDSNGIAYTYSEPSVWYEYVREVAEKAQKNDLKNVMVSNGYISKEPLEELIPYLDAANIDLKSYSNQFYRELCSGSLEPVLNNIEMLNQNSVHIELTTLIITGFNDSLTELEKLFSWIEDLNPDIPLHLSRYFPRYKLKKTATSIKKMKEAYELAREYLNYVYLGNVNLDENKNTYCPECGKIVIERNYYKVSTILKDDNCPECGKRIYGRF